MKNKKRQRQTYDMVIANTIRVIMILCCINQIFLHKYMDAFNAFLCFLLTYLPAIINKKAIYLPKFLQVVMMVFIFLSMYLGEINRVYAKLPGFDKFLHTSSGLILGVIGFILVYELNGKKNVGIKLSPFFACVFAFVFSVAAGAIWEIYEFACDQLFGWNMQNWKATGVEDTMWDIIVDSIGALSASIIGYFYLKKENFDLEKIKKLERNKEKHE